MDIPKNGKLWMVLVSVLLMVISFTTGLLMAEDHHVGEIKQLETIQAKHAIELATLKTKLDNMADDIREIKEAVKP